ncbi:YHS domain-containing (seleno)protein [uncultured Tateyamaria sp.]|uniref:YHS domain-containing (seleno)protein n=1 Tax=uncultured Tateyamaria sp. TaxID=455651 RepID=UPI002634D68A|nr:YHS domain-containing (seleno)protein [uncultured Tateyamaria sp.]
MKNFATTSAIVLALLGSSVAMTPAFAADEFNVAPGLTYAGVPLGLHGADPVALLAGNQVEGDAQFFAAHDGVAYYFTSAENQAAFEANPAKFMPQNGGFCTLGVAYAKKLDGNPDYATVVDGKLFVFVNQAALDAFNKDQAALTAQADENWVKIKSVKATDL